MDKDYELIKDDNSTYFRPLDNIIEKKNGKELLRLPNKVIETLVKKQYGVYGHSAVQICSWTKKSLTGKGNCYKHQFYGVETFNCMELSPAAMWCQQNCTFCWRPMEFMKNIKIDKDKVDEPEDIIKNLYEERKKLLSGFKGNPLTNLELYKKTTEEMPSHYAISLSGEPTMYPKLPEMVEYLKTLKNTKSIFVVTNAQEPDYFERLKKEPKYQPTQLYISIDAPNEELFNKINRSLYKNGFERLKKSLEIYSKLNCRKVFRYTQIKGLNDKEEHLEGYKQLIELGKPDFIEVKAFMFIGMARERHTEDQMPTFDEVLDFAKKLEKYLGNYKLVDMMPRSRICLLHRYDSSHTPKIEIFENEK